MAFTICRSFHLLFTQTQPTSKPLFKELPNSPLLSLVAQNLHNVSGSLVELDPTATDPIWSFLSRQGRPTVPRPAGPTRGRVGWSSCRSWSVTQSASGSVSHYLLYFLEERKGKCQGYMMFHDPFDKFFEEIFLGRSDGWLMVTTNQWSRYCGAGRPGRNASCEVRWAAGLVLG